MLRIGRPGAGSRRRTGRLFLWLAVAAFVLAAARPVAGTEATKSNGILELVIDVSSSTQADDVTPTRLGAIQQATIRLLDRVPRRVRVGLVVFSDTPQTLVRPTTDLQAVKGQLAALQYGPGTAIGDALRQALADLQASRPAAPAWLLLISDGSNTAGGSPLDAARLAAERKVPVLAVALGTPDGTVTVADETGIPRQVPVPADLAQLTGIAGATGGEAVAARSAPELETALGDLLGRTGLESQQRDLTMLFAAAALVLLAVGGALAPRRSARDRGAGRRAVTWRWTPSAALLAVAAGTVLAWAHWVAPGPTPTPAAASVGTIAHPPVIAPASPPPFVTIDGTRQDQTLVARAVALLRRHGELAEQRGAEIERHHLNQVGRLDLSTCDVCKGGPLTINNGGYQTVNGNPGSCATLLNTGFIRQQSRNWRVDLTRLVAMVVLHEQELCLHREQSTTSPADAEQRLARKLHDGRLFDRFYAQIDAAAGDRGTVEQALDIVGDHGELALQRRDSIRRRHLNQVDPLRITMCRGCDSSLFGASTVEEADHTVACDVLLGMSRIESDARNWGLPEAEVLAVLLVHEQEHCIRHPDDRETFALDQEVSLARKLGRARLIEYVTASYKDLDETGHWKR